MDSDLTERHTGEAARRVGCRDEDGDGVEEEMLRLLREVPMEKLLDGAMEY